jgi:hypothetical protein
MDQDSEKMPGFVGAADIARVVFDPEEIGRERNSAGQADLAGQGSNQESFTPLDMRHGLVKAFNE